MKKLTKNKVGLLWVALIVLTAPIFSTAQTNNDLAGVPTTYGELKNMTFYFHNESVSQYVADYSTTYIFNTILGSKQENIARWGSVAVDFYLYPQLAGDITITGNVSVIFYMNMSATSNNFNGNFAVWLYDVSYIAPDGTENSTQIGNAQVALVLTTNRAAYGVTITNLNWTVEKGHTLRVRISLSGGASNYYFLWFGTGNYDSRIIIQTRDSICVDTIKTYNSEKCQTNWFSPQAENTTILVETNITDPYGGYDIYLVTMTVKNADGNIIPWLDNCTMSRVSGNNKSFLSIYAYSFNYSSLSPGKYQIIVWALDLNGYYWYTHFQQFNYGPYPDTGEIYFFIGGFPVSVDFKCLDANNLPLKNATLTAFLKSTPIAYNQTDVNGNTTLNLIPGNYTFQVHFETVLVAETFAEIPENFSGIIVIWCRVYKVDIKVMTADGTPLENALVFLTKPNRETIEVKTNKDGVIANNPLLVQMPIGNYSARIIWKGLEVGKNILYIDHNSPPSYTLVAEVFNVRFIARDSHGNALDRVQIVAEDNETGFLIDFGIADTNGSIILRLPLIVVDIQAYWEGVLVYSGTYLVKDICTKETLLNCSVFYLTLFVGNANGIALPGTICTLYKENALYGFNLTNTTGICKIRVPAGNYTLYVLYRGTEGFSHVEESREVNLEILGDTEYAITLGTIPPPFYATNLGAVSAVFSLLLMLLILLAIKILLDRKKQKRGGTQKLN